MTGVDCLIAASPNCLFGFSTWVAFRELARAGLKYVEIPASPHGTDGYFPEVMNADDVSTLKNDLGALGLSPISVGAYCDLLVDREVECLLRRIDLANKLGAPNVVSDATHQNEVDRDDWRKVVNRLRFAGDYAADRSVKIALETHGGLTRNGALCRTLLDAVDHDAIGVNYDTGNVYYYNDDIDPAEDVKLVADKVFQVHLKDTLGGKGEWQFCSLGEGRVRFPAVIATLQSVGFRGPYSLELEGRATADLNREDNRQIVSASLDYLRRIGLTSL